MRDKKELEKSLRYFRHKAEYTVESDERKEMYVIAAETVEKVLNPDFVQVVRCRDCKHGREQNAEEKVVSQLLPEILICNHPDVSEYCWQGVWPNHYCSYGERREEG